MKILAEDLHFPEGPVAMRDGSVLFDVLLTVCVLPPSPRGLPV